MFLSDLYNRIKDFAGEAGNAFNQNIAQPVERGMQQSNDVVSRLQQRVQGFENSNPIGRGIRSFQDTSNEIPQQIIPSMGKIGRQTFNHPVSTLESATTGTYQGLQPMMSRLAQAVHPNITFESLGATPQQATALRERDQQLNQQITQYPGPFKNLDEAIYNHQPQNDIERSIEGGYKIAGGMAPYMVSGDAMGATSLAKNSPRLANYLGWTGMSQSLSDKKLTDWKGRIKQLAEDTAMFGLTGGLRKPKLSRLEKDWGNYEPATHYAVLDINKLKTKSQLKELWNKNKLPIKKTPSIGLTIRDVSKERGFVTTIKSSPKTSLKIAQGVKGRYIPIKNKTTISKAQASIGKNFEKAVTRAKTEKNITTKIQAESLTLIDRLQQKGRYDDAIDIVEAMSERATKGGQATQVLSAYNRLTPEGVLSFAERGVKKAKNANPRKFKDLRIKPEQAKKIRKMAENIKVLSGEEKETATRNMLDEIARIAPSSWARKVTTLWKAGLLTGIKGAVGGNTVGNTAMGILKKVSDVPASAIDSALSVATGNRSKVFTMKGLLSGAFKGLKSGVSNFKKGVGANDISSKLDYQKVYFSKGPLGRMAQKYTDSVFNFYSASDRPFFHSALKNSLYDFATVEAKNAGLKGKASKKFIENLVKNPPEEFLAKAVNSAEDVVFQNKNALGQGLSGFKKGIKKHGGSLGEIISEGVLPFTGVPSAIATAVHHYSPTGMFFEVYRAIREVAKSKALTQGSQRKLAEALGKGLTGTGVMYLGAKLTKSGQMTLGYPKDAGERTLWEQEDKQPYSIKLFGKWRSLNYSGPVMSLLAIGGEVQKADEKGIKAVSAGVAGSGKAIINSSPLSGLQSSLDAITDPQRYGKNYVQNQSSSVVPTIVKDIANSTDPYIREHNNIRESIQNKVPFLKNKLNIKRDFFGEKVERKTGPVEALIDPFKSSGKTSDEVVSELRNLQDKEQGPTLSSLKKSQTVFGQKIKLTPEELNKLKEVSGKQIKILMKDTINSQDYKSLSDEDKKKVLNNIVNGARKETKQNLALSSGEGIESFNVKGLATKNKMDIAKKLLLDSNKSSVKVEGGYLRKNVNGDGAVFVSENKYKLQLVEQSLVKNKRNKNIDLWLKNAQKKYLLLQTELNNPNSDELDKETIQNKIDTLEAQYAKYKGYGGFKKPKKPKKLKNAKAIKKLNIRFAKPTKLSSTRISLNPVRLPSLTPIRAKKLNLKIRAKKIRIKK